MFCQHLSSKWRREVQLEEKTTRAIELRLGSSHVLGEWLACGQTTACSVAS